MWESRLSGSERGRSTTVAWMRYCGTVAKAGGQQRKQTSSWSHGSLLPTRNHQGTALSPCTAGTYVPAAPHRYSALIRGYRRTYSTRIS